MDITQVINRSVERLRRTLLIEDKYSTVTLKKTPIQQIQNVPMSQPLADLEVFKDGKKHLFHIFHSGLGGGITTVPVFQGSKI
ncbi:hypothetical protein COPG_00028 [Colwellia phage 9A]|uniref:Uncharacterized protein n=1 Tax=Colwellia phage 9A TaxID=765765 RepID=I3UMA9_9CAUD|nr:hypothetical protein COPG_00028 [Colwellia phage 9A]AFK66624.1 hypothetical protein COPG_00028 [Colwellia phage 9A]